MSNPNLIQPKVVRSGIVIISKTWGIGNIISPGWEGNQWASTLGTFNWATGNNTVPSRYDGVYFWGISLRCLAIE